MKRYSYLFLVAIAAFVVYACSKNNNNGENTSNDEFKNKMLINYSDTLILPAYQNFQSKLLLLEQASDNFLAAPGTGTQTALRTPFKDAYIAFESISALNFGPAASLYLNSKSNSFPSNITKIETAVQSGVYNFSQALAADSIQGLPALDYLYFNASAIIQFTGSTATIRKQYVRDIIAQMKSVLAATIQQWNTTYRDHFVNNLQTNVGSSIGSLINQFAFEMDAMKGPRIGWPFGKQSNGIVFANKCEGYYSGISKDLALANLTALKKYFSGDVGNGISEYLVLLRKTQLNTDVMLQFDIALTAINAIPDPMSAAFTGSASTVENAYREVQKLLTLIKTDVASATAVQITYMDNDGD